MLISSFAPFPMRRRITYPRTDDASLGDAS